MTSLRAELAAQVRLAGPVALVNLSMMSMGVVDTTMAGDLSTSAQAAIGLGHAWVWCPLSFAMGLVLAIDPLVAQARGARDEPGMARAVQRGLILAALASLPVAGVLLASRAAFALLPQLGIDLDQALVPAAAGYAEVSTLGVPAMLGFLALRTTLQAMERVAVIVGVALVANLLNVLGNGVLMNGWLGFPSLGAVGSAWSTVICQWFLVVALLVVARRSLGPVVWPPRERVLALRPLLRMAGLGLPIGVAIALESGAFNMVQFLMADYGAAIMAGHRTAIVIASTSFMVPLGISAAAAVRVGHAVGEGDLPSARRAARVALALGALVMLGFGALFVLLPGPLARAFSMDPAVTAVTLTLLPVAAAFQLFDGLQVVAAGVLRGTADTVWPSLLNFVGYWVVGLPAGAYWAFGHDGGALALWWGLAGGLLLVALALLWRVVARLSGEVVRFDAEGHRRPG